MKHLRQHLCFLLFQFCALFGMAYSATEIPADHPYIQYFGRWDLSNPLAPSHSWPGVYIYAEFEGTSIGVKLTDNYTYFNVFIDGELTKVFKGDKAGLASYTLASGLADTKHTILFTKRCETTWTKFTFNGFVLDNGKTLLPPPDRPIRKIEFIGDSFTSASGNEYTKTDAPADVAFYTNIYEGFAPIVARHYNAQYHATSISGYGVVLDWTGDYAKNVPDFFAGTHLYTVEPKWNFSSWEPNLVVIGLGLNDYSGFGGWTVGVAPEETELYKTRYHEFIQTIRDFYPGVKILAVAAHVPWMQTTISQIVTEENASGNNDVFYAFYHYYEGGYVNTGHPSVATHYKIADELIAAIDQINAWEPYDDDRAPAFTKLPDSPFTIYATSYTLKVETNSYATVRFSTEDKPYDQMEQEFAITGERKHSVTFPCEHNHQYTYYLRAIDPKGNKMDTSAVVSFNVDTTKSIVGWWQVGFDDSEWKIGTAPLGFGNNGEATTTTETKTIYFRRTVELSDVASLSRVSAILQYDNGGIVYVNGTELGRVNMPTDEIAYDTGASNSNDGNLVFTFKTDQLSLLKNGTNLIAAEVHQNSTDAADLIFDLKFRATQTYIDYGSTWKYYDGGKQPDNQLVSTGVASRGKDQPSKFRLLQNYPNPFNPTTSITFELLQAGRTTLAVYNLLGQKVRTLVAGTLSAGIHQINFDGSDLPSGEYLYHLQSGNFTEVKKFLILK
jgi:hypothetical protein